jgi:ketosteroid isomerase-like protein
MSNVETVQAIYEAFGRGDIPFILEQLADDVRWEDGAAADHGVPWLKPGVGRDHVAGFFGELGAIEFRGFDVTNVMGDGDVVMALIDLKATYNPTGKAFDGLEVHVWRFGPDGKVASFNHVVDTHQMVLAVQG